MNKRLLVAITGALAVFGVVLGMAASLGGITSDSLGADDAAVASCDTNGVTTRYAVAYSTTGTAGYKVGDVTVGGIAAACNNAAMKVVLTGSGNATLAEQTATVAVDGGTDTSDVVSFSGSNVLAESVTGVHVVISG